MKEPAEGNKYILSEMEVFGIGGLVPRPKNSPEAAGNRMYLSGGNWKIQRSSEVVADGEHISRPEFPVDGWVVATVPGTALVSYWNAGASALDEPPVLAVNGMADLDWYFDPTAAYFGCKKACEPIHIQWNPVYDEVETVNIHAGNRTGLTARAQIFNMERSLQLKYQDSI